jgi:hypothetical protein
MGEIFIRRLNIELKNFEELDLQTALSLRFIYPQITQINADF